MLCLLFGSLLVLSTTIVTANVAVDAPQQDQGHHFLDLVWQKDHSYSKYINGGQLMEDSHGEPYILDYNDNGISRLSINETGLPVWQYTPPPRVNQDQFWLWADTAVSQDKKTLYFILGLYWRQTLKKEKEKGTRPDYTLKARSARARRFGETVETCGWFNPDRNAPWYGGALIAVDAATGVELWNATNSSFQPYLDDVFVVDNKVLVILQQSVVTAFDLTNKGEQLWATNPYAPQPQLIVPLMQKRHQGQFLQLNYGGIQLIDAYSGNATQTLDLAGEGEACSRGEFSTSSLQSLKLTEDESFVFALCSEPGYYLVSLNGNATTNMTLVANSTFEGTTFKAPDVLDYCLNEAQQVIFAIASTSSDAYNGHGGVYAINYTSEELAWKAEHTGQFLSDYPGPAFCDKKGHLPGYFWHSFDVRTPAGGYLQLYNGTDMTGTFKGFSSQCEWNFQEDTASNNFISAHDGVTWIGKEQSFLTCNYSTYEPRNVTVPQMLQSNGLGASLTQKGDYLLATPCSGDYQTTLMRYVSRP